MLDNVLEPWICPLKEEVSGKTYDIHFPCNAFIFLENLVRNKQLIIIQLSDKPSYKTSAIMHFNNWKFFWNNLLWNVQSESCKYPYVLQCLAKRVPRLNQCEIIYCTYRDWRLIPFEVCSFTCSTICASDRSTSQWILGITNSYSIALCWILSTSSNILPLKTVWTFGNIRKTQEVISSE